MTQEFQISVTPVGQDKYLVRTERVARGVVLGEERVSWPVDNWLAQTSQLLHDPLLGLLEGQSYDRVPSAGNEAATAPALADLEDAEGSNRSGMAVKPDRWIEPLHPNLVALGQRLYNALFQGTMRDSWLNAQAVARNRHEVLRLRLGLRDRRLLALPWEVLHAGNHPLASGTEVMFSRYYMAPGSVHLPSTDGLAVSQDQPLRILMVIAAPTDQERLDLRREVLHLQQELRQSNGQSSNVRSEIQLVILEQPDREQLTQALEQGHFHILHYAGHSNLGAAGGALYLVSGRTGLTETLNGEDLAGLLVNNGIRMAVFNSCRGAYGSSLDGLSQEGEWNLAETLTRRGVPGVLAMAERIPDEVALTLTRLFYRNVGRGYSVDLSLSRARQGLISAYGSQQLYWALPVLYLHPEFDGHLVAGDTSPIALDEVSERPLFPDLSPELEAKAAFYPDTGEVTADRQDESLVMDSRPVPSSVSSTLLTTVAATDAGSPVGSLENSSGPALPVGSTLRQGIPANDFPTPPPDDDEWAAVRDDEPPLFPDLAAVDERPQERMARSLSDLTDMVDDLEYDRPVDYEEEPAAIAHLLRQLSHSDEENESDEVIEPASSIESLLPDVTMASPSYLNLPENPRDRVASPPLPPDAAAPVDTADVMAHIAADYTPGQVQEKSGLRFTPAMNPSSPQPSVFWHWLQSSEAPIVLLFFVGALVVGTIATINLSRWKNNAPVAVSPSPATTLASPLGANGAPSVSLREIETATLTTIAIQQMGRNDLSAGVLSVEELMRRGALDQSSAALAAVPSGSLDQPAIAFLRGRLAWERTNRGDRDASPNDARRFWEMAVRSQSNPLYRNALGFVYYTEGQGARAEQQWRQVILAFEGQTPTPVMTLDAPTQVNGRLAMAYAGLALLAMQNLQGLSPSERAQRIAQATEFYQRAVNLEPLNLQPQALAQNWLWNQKMLQDWHNLVKQVNR